MATREHRDDGYLGAPQDPLRSWRLAWIKEPRYAPADLDRVLERHRRARQLHRRRRSG